MFKLLCDLTPLPLAKPSSWLSYPLTSEDVYEAESKGRAPKEQPSVG